ncbi:uncharacterized protein LOC130752824 [Actinidia eriantha]|uniref:uncharacterized protein LOC130752824 n=1 Tax=Actinidia eriantha TaxID=165200 RepID=UPI00258997F1|nr:uncharacterized protein LOC130752824 [Actinidia eriantha]
MTLRPFLAGSFLQSTILFFSVQILSLSLFSWRIPDFTMEKHAQDCEVTKKDEQREGFCKGACEYKPSKSISDRLLPHILNLYGSCATARDFEIYAPDATFEDPLMCAHGIKQIKSAFYSIPKIFGESRIVEYSIEENVISPSKQEILIDNKQHYKFLGKGIDMISLIKLDVEDGKIIRHEDRWDKKPLRNRETVKLPIVGRVLELTRRGSMLATHAMMGFGKDPTV